MSVAEVAVEATPMEELGRALVGRTLMLNGRLHTVTAFDGGRVGTSLGEWVTVAEATLAVLPEPGTVVSMYGRDLVWLEVRCIESGALTVLVLIDGLVQTRVIHDPATVVVLPEREQESARTVEVVLHMHRQIEQWKAELNDAANEWADDNDLCGRYDDFMEQQGLSARSRDYEATITIRLTRTVTGRSFDDAVAVITDEDVAEWVEAEGRHLDWSAEED